LGKAGQVLVFVGLVAFIAAAILSVLGAKHPKLVKLSNLAFGVGSLTIFGAFGILATLFVKNQFQFANVFDHGDIHTSLAYKISGVWSGQQGSFILWATTSSIFGLLSMWSLGKYRPVYMAVYSGCLATICGILAYESPFTIFPAWLVNGKVHVPPTGQGLEPSLMNYWMVIHPPTIFTGFGALTVLFAYSVAAIFLGDLKEWVVRVRPWALVITGILGIGICMGGFWAYETLGWGGFWAWDPVENASFIPWIFTVAFVHGAIVQTTKSRWHGTNLWLAALAYLSFCYGTFLTRSGLLDNVSNHSFASMDKSALIILKFFLAFVVAGFIALYLVRGKVLAKAANLTSDDAVGIGRENLYGAGSLLLALTAAVLSLGMSWPVMMALTGRQAARVEEGLYHKVVVWFFLPIVLLIAITPFVSWRAMDVKGIVRRVANIFSLSVALTGVSLLLLRVPDWGVRANASSTVSMPFHLRMATVPWIAILLLFCAFAFVANAWRAIEIGRRSPGGIGGFIAHLGIATLFAGMVLSRGLEQKEYFEMAGNETHDALGFQFKFAGMSTQDIYDRDAHANFEVTGPDGKMFTATPGLYWLHQQGEDGEEKAMSWPYIRHYGFHDFYFSLGKPIITVWPKPEWFHEGETRTVNGLTVTYKKMVTEGQLGTPSAKFGADLDIADRNQTFQVTPHFSVADGPDLPSVNNSLRVALTQIEAADKSVALQMFFASPIYPIEVFTKPLTIFVWTGAGIMTLGGLWSAFYRRRKGAADKPDLSSEAEKATA